MSLFKAPARKITHVCMATGGERVNVLISLLVFFLEPQEAVKENDREGFLTAQQLAQLAQSACYPKGIPRLQLEVGNAGRECSLDLSWAVHKACAGWVRQAIKVKLFSQLSRNGRVGTVFHVPFLP